MLKERFYGYSMAILAFGLLGWLSCRPAEPAARPEEPDRMAYGQQGDGIKHYTFAGPDFIEGDYCFHRRVHFYGDGRLESDVEYELCDVVWKTILYHYDDRGTLYASSLASRYENAEYVWKYDESGRLTELRSALPTSFYPSRIRYEYDSEGRLIREKGDFVNGMPARQNCRIEYEYEGSRKSISRYFGGPECNEIEQEVHHFFDDLGREIQRHLYSDPEMNDFDVMHLYYAYY